MSKEQSAIDKIYKIEEDIEFIKVSLQLIDNNLKLLMNKLNKVTKELAEQPAPAPPVKVTATPGAPLAPREKRVESDALVLGKIKVFGYVVNSNKHPLENIEVNVFDNNNEIIKKRKTDKEGYWEVRLPPGKYGIEYIQEGYHPVNKVITLDKNIKSFEVRNAPA